jgi:hypothetical protein
MNLEDTIKKLKPKVTKELAKRGYKAKVGVYQAVFQSEF